jgi:hypothetical protein
MRVSEEDHLVYALMSEMCEGFGCQVEPSRRCMYIAQCFKDGDKPHAHSTDMPESALALVHGFIPADKIWLTDFCGREWVTLHVDYFNEIPRIYNTLLDAGYRVLTHTPVKTQFKPGDVFSLRTFELHLIETIHANLAMLDSLDEHARWDFIRRTLTLRSLLKPYNWSTDEGRVFSAQLRARFNKPVVPKTHVQKSRFANARYVAACRQHGILFAGGWGACEPPFVEAAVVETAVKKPHVEEDVEEEQECMICLDAMADTLVLPCEDRVVCKACSIGLRATPDVRTCVKCRRPITHVLE